MRAIEILQQLLISGSLLQRIELDTVQVLQKSIPQQLLVRGIANDRRNRLESGLLRRAQTPFAHDQFIVGVLLISFAIDSPYNDGLKKTDLLD